MGHRKIRLIARLVTLSLALVMLAGCAAHFSPDSIRREISAQRGNDPVGVFELNLGRLTTSLLKRAISDPNQELAFAGIRELQLAVFEAPSDEGPSIDATLIDSRGWEPVVKILDAERSGVVLIRGTGLSKWGLPDSQAQVGDLVVVGAGRKNVVYARIQGVLSNDLPDALGDVFREGGTEDLQRVLSELGD